MSNFTSFFSQALQANNAPTLSGAPSRVELPRRKRDLDCFDSSYMRDMIREK